MHSCPVCSIPLTRASSDYGLLWGCERCGGCAVSIAVLRKTVLKEAVNHLWSSIVRAQGPHARSCPSCLRSMIEVSAGENGSGPRVEGCKPCELFWFDRNEFDQLPSTPASGEAAPSLPEEARRELGPYEARRIAERARGQEDGYLMDAVSIGRFSRALFRLLGR